MKIKELIKNLEQYNQEAQVFISSDEELNTIYEDLMGGYLEDKTKVVLWGNSGSELNE